jgi:hypothetical protein
VEQGSQVVRTQPQGVDRIREQWCSGTNELWESSSFFGVKRDRSYYGEGTAGSCKATTDGGCIQVT